MDYSCPHCSCSLKDHKVLTVPSNGSRNLLTFKMTLLCPSCNSRLKINHHKFEQRITQIYVLVFLSAIVAIPFYFEVWLGATLLLVTGILEIASSLYSVRYLQNWKRYAVKH